MSEDLAAGLPAADAPAPAPDTSLPPPAAPTEAAQPPVDDDAALSAIWRKNNPLRDVDGRYLSRQAEQPEAPPADPASVQQPEAKPIEPAKPAIDAPTSWTAERKADFATLPPQVQEYILQRDKEASAAISRQGQALAAWEPLGKVVEQHREAFDRLGIPPAEGIGRLLEANRRLDENPVAAIQWLAQSYGVDLRMFAGEQGNGAEQAANPMIAELRAEIAALKREHSQTASRIGARERQEAEAQLAQTQSIIDGFSKENPEFESLAETVYAAVNRIKVEQPNLGPKELLKAAYDDARWSRPDLRAKLIDEQAKAAEAKRLEEAKAKAAKAQKAAGLNVQGMPKPAQQQDETAELRAIWRKHHAA